jgi:hypothetical protein
MDYSVRNLECYPVRELLSGCRSCRVLIDAVSNFPGDVESDESLGDRVCEVALHEGAMCGRRVSVAVWEDGIHERVQVEILCH